MNNGFFSVIEGIDGSGKIYSFLRLSGQKKKQAAP